MMLFDGFTSYFDLILNNIQGFPEPEGVLDALVTNFVSRMESKCYIGKWSSMSKLPDIVFSKMGITCVNIWRIWSRFPKF